MRIFVALALLTLAAAAAAAAAAPSAQGVIVFERRSTAAGSDVFSVRADGTALRRLTRTGNNLDPALSDDGRWIVFASHRRHRPGVSELYVMRANGTRLRRLTRNAATRQAFTTDRDPAWSPDGKKIVFSRTFVRGRSSSTDLFSIPAAGGPAERLTYTAGVEVSPTYSLPFQIAFVRKGFVYQRVGTGQIRQQAGADPDWTRAHQFPAWSRDGAVFRGSLDGEVRVGSGADPVWSPDGTQLAWVTPAGLVVDGQPLTRPPRGARDLSPSWS